MDMNVQRFVLAHLSRRPKTIEVGPFVIGWDPTSDSRHLNYATPRPGAAPTARDVAALVAAFRDLGRTPRLEYVPSCAPELERALLAAGFTVEARHEYLVCTPESLVVPPQPEGFTIAEPLTDEDRYAAVAAQNEAFGEPGVAAPEDVARIRQTQQAGGIVVFATGADGTCAGAGQCSAPSAGLVEISGIGVRESFRKQGIAGALTAAITASAFVGGAEAAWLEASGPDSWRVYERVGFVAAGKRLYVALD